MFQTAKYIATLSLNIMFTATYFDISVSLSGSFKNFVPRQVTQVLKNKALKITITVTVTLNENFRTFLLVSWECQTN
jgi:hypothetical protein